MALADLDAFVDAIAHPDDHVQFHKVPATWSGTGREATFQAYFTRTGFPGAFDVPTTAVAVDASTQGAIQRNRPTGSQMVARVVPGFDQWAASESIDRFCWVLVDVLAVQGGLDGTLTSTQTTNLPTAALTRYTSGVGVIPLMVMTTSLGTANTQATISYTNQAGTPGRTGRTAELVDTPSPGLAHAFTMEGSDTGCRSVESLTLSVNTTTAGAFGVWLVKPLAMILQGSGETVAANNIVGWNTGILQDACLSVMSTTRVSTGNGSLASMAIDLTVI